MPEFPVSDITYEDGSIVQIDTYIPEVRTGEISVGVDLAKLSETQPIGTINIDQNIVTTAGFSAPIASNGYQLINMGGNDIKIKNYIGRIHPGGVAVAVSLYDMQSAMHDLKAFAREF